MWQIIQSIAVVRCSYQMSLKLVTMSHRKLRSLMFQPRNAGLLQPIPEAARREIHEDIRGRKSCYSGCNSMELMAQNTNWLVSILEDYRLCYSTWQSCISSCCCRYKTVNPTELNIQKASNDYEILGKGCKTVYSKCKKAIEFGFCHSQYLKFTQSWLLWDDQHQG